MKRWDLPQKKLQVSRPSDDWPDDQVNATMPAPMAAELHVGRQPQAVAPAVVVPESSKRLKSKKRQLLLLAALLLFAGWLSFMTFRKPAVVAAIGSFRQCVDFGYPTTETEPMRCTTAGGQVFTDVAASLPVSSKQNLSFTTLVDAKSGPLKNDLQVIKDQKSWEAFWAKTHARIMPTPPILSVNFSKLAVAGAAMGLKSTDGYRIAITNIYQTEREVDIEVTKSIPGVGCELAPMQLSPYHLVTFAKPSLPTVFVIVEKQQAACETADSVNSSVSGY